MYHKRYTVIKNGNLWALLSKHRKCNPTSSGWCFIDKNRKVTFHELVISLPCKVLTKALVQHPGFSPCLAEREQFLAAIVLGHETNCALWGWKFSISEQGTPPHDGWMLEMWYAVLFHLCHWLFILTRSLNYSFSLSNQY